MLFTHLLACCWGGRHSLDCEGNQFYCINKESPAQIPMKIHRVGVKKWPGIVRVCNDLYLMMRQGLESTAESVWEWISSWLWMHSHEDFILFFFLPHSGVCVCMCTHECTGGARNYHRNDWRLTRSTQERTWQLTPHPAEPRVQPYLVEFLVVGDGQQDVSGGYPGLLVVPRSIASQL